MPEVSKFFDEYAASFDAIYGGETSFLSRLLINPVFRKSMRLRYEKTLAGCQPVAGKSVLDIGCGPGHYGVMLAKRGAGRVVGIDFAPTMIERAQRHAQEAGVADRCEFLVKDLYGYEAPMKFDFSIVMGVMDYIEDPRRFIDRVLELTACRAFFSFPAAGGLLALQRKLRYRKRCDLFMYTREQIAGLLRGLEGRIEPIARDFFVTIEVGK
jgi:2-polyprenyl-3-methyl-5-hydroxy-6-metoxy-1,4-benzoquinol methylase